mmetsp:Transcript_12797/g.44909  ORF Transcript_12797/g.44909 Transcript_12797/m.44909 type:complete len:259 (+) Transcript_12797:633-1409(+)
MYTGIAPDDRVSVGSNSLNVIQLAELSLFSFGKVLLPGMDLPLQIHSDNLNGKRMFDQIPAGNGLFGVVTKNETLKRGSISRVGCEAVLQDKWVTDDGRYILETKGRRPFRIVEIVQWNPYPIAIVQILRDPEVMEDSDMDKKIGSLELQSWRSLNDLVWLATEVFDKRSWLPLLMNLDGKQHPLVLERAHDHLFHDVPFSLIFLISNVSSSMVSDVFLYTGKDETECTRQCGEDRRLAPTVVQSSLSVRIDRSRFTG